MRPTHFVEGLTNRRPVRHEGRYRVTPDYFQTMGIAVLQPYVHHLQEGAAPVAIITKPWP